MHAALMAAAGMAAREAPGYCSGRDLHLCSTISNRRMLGTPEDCGVFFTACGFALEEGRGREFWDLARAVKDTLRTVQSEDGAKAVLAAVGEVVRTCEDALSGGEQGARLFRFDLHVSNLGAIKIPTCYGRLSLRQVWGPAVLVGYEGEQTLGVSTVNGRLCLLHTSHSPLDGFLKQVEEILSAACTS